MIIRNESTIIRNQAIIRIRHSSAIHPQFVRRSREASDLYWKSVPDSWQFPIYENSWSIRKLLNLYKTL